MLDFIRKSLEVKITLALIGVLCLVIGVYAVIDIRTMRSDMIRASQQSMGALAGTIKGEVTAAMRQGYHEDVQRIIDEARTSFGAEQIVIYDDSGKVLRSTEARDAFRKSINQLPETTLKSAAAGDVNQIQTQGGRHLLTYYSPIGNRAECVRCHGNGHQLNGILRIDFPLQGVEALIAARRSSIMLWSAIMVVVLMASLAVLLRLFVHRPVQELRSAMELAGAGAGELTLSPEGRDELSDLKRRFVGLVHRISALHRSNLDKEKELARSGELLRFRAELQTMFDAMPDGVLLIDEEMRVVQSNPRIHDLLPGLEETGRIAPEPGNKESCPFHGIGQVLKEGRVAAHQCSIVLANGETKHLHSICAPIMEDGRVAYVVEVIRDITERVKTEHELEEKTSQLLAANRQLARIAITDSLTQVHNRRHFDELMFKEIKRFTRRKYSSLSLMMIDIDHFKKLNDRYGHLAGDTVLRDMAKLLRENVRETDTVARYGGEEFVIVMPDTHLDGAAYRAESLRKKIERNRFPGHDTPLAVTVSIGVAGYVAGAPQDLVQLADRALYEAKRSGRNTVVVSKPEVTVKG